MADLSDWCSLGTNHWAPFKLNFGRIMKTVVKRGNNPSVVS